MADAALELSDFSPLQEAQSLSEYMAAAGAVADVLLPEFRARNPLTDPTVFAWWLAGATSQFFHQRVDAEARELQFGSAQRVSSMESWLRLLGRPMRPKTAAEVDVVVAMRDGPSSLRDTPIPRYQHFETPAGVRFCLFAGDSRIGMGLSSVRLRLIHGEYRVEPLDPSDGTRLQMRVTQTGNVVQGATQKTVTVLVGPSEAGPFEAYEVVDSLHAAGPSDAQVVFRHGPDGRGIFVFGDGVNGKIPPIGHVPFASFISGGGDAGNVAAGQIQSLVGDLVVAGETVAVTVTQPLAAEGGIEEETVEQARVRAPSEWEALGGAITLPNYEALARQVPGVVDARARRRGLDLVEIAIIGTGLAGVPSGGLLSAVEAWIKDRCWGLDTVRAVAGRPVPIHVEQLVRARRGNLPEKLKPQLEAIVDAFFDLAKRSARGDALFGDPTSTTGHAYESDLVGLFEAHAGVQNVDGQIFARTPAVEWERRAGVVSIVELDATNAREAEEIEVRFANASTFQVLGSVSGDLGWGSIGEPFESANGAVSFKALGGAAYGDVARFGVSPVRGPVKCAADEYFVKGAVALTVVRS